MDFVGIDKLSLLDFDGYVSVVLFAPTCNFRCPFCHNGESVLNSSTTIPFDQILNYIESRRNIYDAVVITGGEPTLMDDLVNKIKTLRNLGLKIKLDTNGTNSSVLKMLLEEKLLDYVAMDIKNSEEKYPLTTGCKKVDINEIKQSISLIINSGLEYEFRTTLVKDFHSKNDIDGLGKLINGSKQLYLQKFVDREGVIKKGLSPIDEKDALSYKDILIKYVNNVDLRGY